MAQSKQPAVRFGVLGCAGIARKVVRAMCLAQNAEAVAVGSRSLSKAQAFATELQEICGAKVRPYGSYKEVIADPNVDAVYCPLPAGLHKEWVTKIAEAGKHLLLEKPPALSLEDMEQIAEACQKAGVMVMDGSMWLHNPRTAAMRAVLDDQQVFGRLQHVTTGFSFLLQNEADIRLQPHLDGLGALGDIGWYCTQFTLWAMHWELPEKVAGHLGARRNSQGVLRSCGASLAWKNGRTASFTVSFDAALKSYAEVAGDKAYIRLTDFLIPAEESECGFTLATNCHWVAHDTKDGSDYDYRKVSLRVPQDACMVEEFSRLVLERRAGRVDAGSEWLEHTKATFRVVLAIEESLRLDNQVIHV